MGCEGRKVYVEVNVTHRADGSALPNFIYFENDDEEAFFFLDGKTVLVESDLNYDNKSKGRKNFTLMHEGTATLFFCVDRVVLVKKEKLAKNPVFPYSHNKNACYT